MYRNVHPDLSLAVTPSKPKAETVNKGRPTRAKPPFYDPNAEPEGVLFVMISGNTGTGFDDLASLLVDDLDVVQIAVECVSDESFHTGAF